jgi:DNA-binding HxlR family transcriptional regulator
MRFSRIMENVAGVSQKSLTKTLRGLERDGLITRAVFAEVPPRVEYGYTAGHRDAQQCGTPVAMGRKEYPSLPRCARHFRSALEVSFCYAGCFGLATLVCRLMFRSPNG